MTIEATADVSLVPSRRRRGGMFTPWRILRLKRSPFRALTAERLALGGRLGDAGRLPRYGLSVLLVLIGIWAPIGAYLKLAPLRFSSEVSLILPGAGASSSINLSDIGQASSSANSAYSSSTLSPTVTYRNLLESARVLERAAAALGEPVSALGKPRIKLLDQTSLIHVQMNGASPDAAQARAEAVLDAFLVELDKLRSDEITRRERSTTDVVDAYKQKVDEARAQIAALQAASGLNSQEQYASIIAGNETLKARIAEAEATLNERDRLSATLSATLGISSRAAAMALKLRADPEYATLAGALAKETASRAEAGDQYGPNHPKIVGANNRIAGLRQKMTERGMALTGLSVDQLEREIDMSSDGERAGLLARLVTLLAETDGLRAELATFRQTLAAGEARVRALAGAARDLDGLERDYKVAEAVFASALARINTSKADLFASYPMVQIAGPPSLALTPSSPNVLIAVAAGVAATLFALVGLALAWIRRPVINRLLKTFAAGA